MIREYIYFVDDNPNGTSGMTEEEVVRCKDCVYWKYRANYKGDEWGACLFLEDVEHWTEDTAFCSFGERGEE